MTVAHFFSPGAAWQSALKVVSQSFPLFVCLTIPMKCTTSLSHIDFLMNLVQKLRAVREALRNCNFGRKHRAQFGKTIAHSCRPA